MTNEEIEVIANANTSEKKPVIEMIDCTTGEVTDVLYEGDSYSKKTKQQTEYDLTHVKNFNKGVKFIKVYPEIMSILADKLSPGELKLVTKIMNYIEYESSIISIGYGQWKHPMTLLEMADEFNVDYTSLTKTMNRLIKKGIVGEFKAGDMHCTKLSKIYVANPYIFINGKNPNKKVENYFFSHTGWKEVIQG